jgi:uncharacterized metal-binding protein
MAGRGSAGETIGLFLLAAFLAAVVGVFTMLILLYVSNLMGSDVPITWLEALVGAVVGLFGGLLLAATGHQLGDAQSAEQRAKRTISAAILGGALAMLILTICGWLTGPWTLIGH